MYTFLQLLSYAATQSRGALIALLYFTFILSSIFAQFLSCFLGFLSASSPFRNCSPHAAEHHPLLTLPLAIVPPPMQDVILCFPEQHHKADMTDDDDDPFDDADHDFLHRVPTQQVMAGPQRHQGSDHRQEGGQRTEAEMMPYDSNRQRPPPAGLAPHPSQASLLSKGLPGPSVELPKPSERPSHGRFSSSGVHKRVSGSGGAGPAMQPARRD